MNNVLTFVGGRRKTEFIFVYSYIYINSRRRYKRCIEAINSIETDRNFVDES